MVSKFFAGMARRHRVVIAIAAVVMAGGVTVGAVAPAYSAVTLLMMVGLFPVVAWSLAIVNADLRRPAAFVVDSRTGSFGAPPDPDAVLLAIATMSLSAALIVCQLPGLHPNRRPLLAAVDWLGSLVWAAPAAWLAIRVWRGVGVQLRPKGLVVREAFGTLIVPWEALAPGLPLPVPSGQDPVCLTFSRPELVRRRGRFPPDGLLPASNVDMRFLAQAVRYYATNPQHRPTIGTQAGYEHLIRAMADSASLG
jgi:hypothetical protein